MSLFEKDENGIILKGSNSSEISKYSIFIDKYTQHRILCLKLGFKFFTFNLFQIHLHIQLNISLSRNTVDMFHLFGI